MMKSKAWNGKDRTEPLGPVGSLYLCVRTTLSQRRLQYPEVEH